jgi:hypothetical protein
VLSTCEVANADLAAPAAPSSVALDTAQVANPEIGARERLERRIEYRPRGGGPAAARRPGGGANPETAPLCSKRL